MFLNRFAPPLLATFFVASAPAIFAQAPTQPNNDTPPVVVKLPPAPLPPSGGQSTTTTTPTGLEVTPPSPPSAPSLPPAPPEPVRLTPQQAASAEFNSISNLYNVGRESQDANRRLHALRTAALRFEQFAKAHAGHPEAQRAWYRRGVCHLLIGQKENAEYCFKYVIRKYKTGQLVAVSAFRLGANRYNDKNYEASVPFFKLAAEETDKPKVRLDSLIRKIHCETLLKKTDDAISTLKVVLENPVDHKDYLNQARMAIGLLYTQSDRHAEAFDSFETIILSPDATAPEINKATIQAGLCAAELQKDDVASDYLSKAIESKIITDSSRSKAVAKLIEIRHRAKDSAGVLTLYSQFAIQTADFDTQVDVLLYAGQAFMDLKRFDDAIRAFTTVDRLDPNSERGFESSYYRLLCFYNLEKATIPDQVDGFFEIHSGKYRESPFMHQALLLKAETLYGMGQFPEAADTYTRIKSELINPAQQADLLYKKGWCLSLSNEHNGAVRSFSKYLSEYPIHPNRMKAIVKRAESYLYLENRSSALQDLEMLQDEDPEVTPVALQIHARILRQEHQYAKMIELFQQLITRYPDLKQDTVANAHYWIGWGHYKLEDYKKAIGFFEKSRAMLPEFYSETAGVHIMQCYYKLFDDENLKTSVNQLLSAIPDKPLPAKMLIWLGLQRQRVGDFRATDQFLTLASTPDEPLLTERDIWRQLTKARLNTGRYEASLESIDFVFQTEEDPKWIADALLDKATAHSRLGEAPAAKQAAQKGLDLKPEGAIKARLLMITGDVFMAEKEYETAASQYLNCAKMFEEDNKVKPLAFYKAIKAYEKMGLPDKAELFRYELENDYPDWEPPVYPKAVKAVMVNPTAADETETPQEESSETEVPDSVDIGTIPPEN